MPLGWSITLTLQTPEEYAQLSNGDDSWLGKWDADVDGLNRLDHLIADGRAVELGGNGYPVFYAVRADVLRPLLRRPKSPDDRFAALPQPRRRKQYIRRTRLKELPADQLITVVAWDMS
jgi:hypothetical protein